MKKNVTISIDEKTINTLRNIVYWTPGLTMSELIDDACTLHIQKLILLKGKDFEPREKNLKSGRPSR